MMVEANISFGEFVEPEKVNPYAETVKALADASEKNANASVTLTVDARKAATERLKFGKAANELGKTARLRLTDNSKAKYGQDENGDQVITGGTVALTFTLTKRHKGRRGATQAAEA